MGKIVRDYAEKDDKKGIFTVSKANALKYGREVMLNKMSAVNEDDDGGNGGKHLHTYWANLEMDANFEKCW